MQADARPSEHKKEKDDSTATHHTTYLRPQVQQMIEEARVDFPPPEPLPGQKLTLDHPEQVKPLVSSCLSYDAPVASVSL